jgi:CTP synthase (UTP-ammonia lyase)
VGMTFVAMVGDRNLAHESHRAIEATVALLRADVNMRWVGTDDPHFRSKAESADAIWALPGTPYANDAAAYAAITHARTTGQPFLGTCGGFQYTMVEFARNVAGWTGAGHAETDPDAAELVVDRLSCSLFGEQRTVTTVPGTRLAKVCGTEPFVGFHFCSFGVPDRQIARLVEHGVVVSAHAEDAGVEGIELPDHPFFVATLFQPQMAAVQGVGVHPLIRALIEAAS